MVSGKPNLSWRWLKKDLLFQGGGVGLIISLGQDITLPKDIIFDHMSFKMRGYERMQLVVFVSYTSASNRAKYIVGPSKVMYELATRALTIQTHDQLTTVINTWFDSFSNARQAHELYSQVWAQFNRFIMMYPDDTSMNLKRIVDFDFRLQR